MPGYIDRESVRIALCGESAITMKGVKILNQLPAADVEVVRHGEWKSLSEKQFCDGSYETTFYCSLCHREVAVCHEAWYGAEKVLIGKYPYCHCGAKMDGKGDV